jgi:hypothetical protein
MRLRAVQAMADDAAGVGLVGGDVADGAARGADAAVDGIDEPSAEQVGACLDAVGMEAAA